MYSVIQTDPTIENITNPQLIFQGFNQTYLDNVRATDGEDIGQFEVIEDKPGYIEPKDNTIYPPRYMLGLYIEVVEICGILRVKGKTEIVESDSTQYRIYKIKCIPK